MPGPSQRKRQKTRRPMRKTKRAYRARATQSVIVRDTPIPVQRSPFKPSAMYTLRYAETVSVNAAGGAIGNYIFTANGLYDCNISGTGHQPLYRDTLAAQYNHYHVHSSRIQLFYTNDRTSNVSAATMIALHLDDDQSPPTSQSDLMENPRVKFKLWHNCPKYNDLMDLNKPIIMRFNARKFFGKTWQDNDMGAPVGSNPDEQAYWIISHCTVPTQVVDIYAYVTVVIDYWVEFSEPKDISGS